MLLGELRVRVEVITAYAQDLGAQLFKTVDCVLKSLHFGGSAGGEVGEVEGENDALLSQVIA